MDGEGHREGKLLRLQRRARDRERAREDKIEDRSSKG